VLTGRTIREELKKICEINNLPSACFSSHSLRKGVITHMRAQGATEDDRRDRGNYSAGSNVMNTTYDYATGLAPD
jgi:integrase